MSVYANGMTMSPITYGMTSASQSIAAYPVAADQGKFTFTSDALSKGRVTIKLNSDLSYGQGANVIWSKGYNLGGEISITFEKATQVQDEDTVDESDPNNLIYKLPMSSGSRRVVFETAGKLNGVSLEVKSLPGGEVSGKASASGNGVVELNPMISWS